jgi:DNA modification methylase
MVLEQPILSPSKSPLATGQKIREREDNKLQRQDHAAHQWYRFVLSFPPHLVRDYIKKFELDESHLVLDPFCGTGTTLVECQKLGIQAVGLESNPVTCFASRTKLDWRIEPDALWDVRISSEKHYKLVAPKEVTEADLLNYRQRTTD